jgi:hypothetical protein
MNRNRKIFVQPGEAGGIINILRLVKREFDRTGFKHTLPTQ